MAIFLLCFDACSDECSRLVAFLQNCQSSTSYPSSREIALGTWAVVEPNSYTAQDVLRIYRKHIPSTQPLSVIGIDGALANRNQNLQVEGAFLHWADRWRIAPTPERSHSE